MTKLTKSDRVIGLISIIWLIIIFTMAFYDSGGDFDEGFVTFFFLVGLIPAFLLIGIKWIIAAGKN